jgi:hypothetical protein
MVNGYRSSRDLEYRVKKNVPILYKIGDVIRVAKYTGEDNYVKYRDTILTVNKFCRFVLEELIQEELVPKRNSNVNVWVSAYVYMRNSKNQRSTVHLKDIPILPEYKKYENNILNNEINNNDLKINRNNDTNSKMTRAKVSIKKTKPRMTKEQKELERRIREYDIRMAKWWDAQPKEIIEDLDEFTKVVFATRKLKGEDNVYEMLNQNKQRMGIIRPWIDKDSKYPPQFKNDDNVVTPVGEPEYEYILEQNCPFHDMPRSTYYKYKFTKVFNKFILTDEIREFKET